MIQTLILATILTVPIPDKPYEVGKYEITQAQWKEIMGTNPSKFKGDDLPVENVNIDDIAKFIARLNFLDKKDGTTWRLPTNAEWTHAFGEKIKVENLFEFAWYRKNTTTPKEVKPGDWQSVGGSAQVVGTKKPNKYGLYDMSGNLWELTAEGNARGGCWWSTDLDCDRDYVSKWDLKSRSEYLGFRLLKEKKK